MKINIGLLFKVVIIEIAYYFAMFYTLLIFMFLYFGSGAGADSPAAKNAEILVNIILVLPPHLFNLFQIWQFNRQGKLEEARSYLMSEVLMILFYTYLISICHLI